MSSRSEDSSGSCALTAQAPGRTIRGYAWRYLLLVIVFQALYAFVLVPSSGFRAYLRGLAGLACEAVGMLGHSAERDADAIRVGSAAFVVVQGCDGLQPAAFLCAAILLTPVSKGARFRAAVLGASCALALNAVRVISLIHFQALDDAKDSRLVDVMHFTIWPFGIILTLIGGWSIWAANAIRADTRDRG